MKSTQNYSVTEAKSKFSEVFHIAQNTPVFVSNRGKEVGVVSKEFYSKARIQNFLQVSKNLSSKLPPNLNLPKRKNRKVFRFPE